MISLFKTKLLTLSYFKFIFSKRKKTKPCGKPSQLLVGGLRAIRKAQGRVSVWNTEVEKYNTEGDG